MNVHACLCVCLVFLTLLGPYVPTSIAIPTIFDLVETFLSLPMRKKAHKSHRMK